MIENRLRSAQIIRIKFMELIIQFTRTVMWNFNTEELTKKYNKIQKATTGSNLSIDTVGPLSNALKPHGSDCELYE